MGADTLLDGREGVDWVGVVWDDARGEALGRRLRGVAFDSLMIRSCSASFACTIEPISASLTVINQHQYQECTHQEHGGKKVFRICLPSGSGVQMPSQTHTHTPPPQALTLHTLHALHAPAKLSDPAGTRISFPLALRANTQSESSPATQNQFTHRSTNNITWTPFHTRYESIV